MKRAWGLAWRDGAQLDIEGMRLALEVRVLHVPERDRDVAARGGVAPSGRWVGLLNRDIVDVNFIHSGYWFSGEGICRSDSGQRRI